MAGYLDSDDEYAQLLAPTINPPDPDTVKTGTSSGVRPAQAPYAQGVSRPPDAGAVRSISPPAQAAAPAQPPAQAQPVAPVQAAVPAAASPSGNASSGPSLRDQLRASLARQSQAVQGSEASTAALQAQPDLGTATAPIEAQRTQLAQPIDPNQQQYKPGLATRIARGFAAGSKGGIAGWLDPSSVGDTPYGAPNSKYGVATAQQAQKLAATDQQLSQSAQAYKDSSTRIKDIAAGQKNDTLGERDLQSSINTAQKGDQQYQEAIAKLGQKEVDDPDNAGQKKLVDDPDSAVFKNRQDLDNYRQSMEKVAQLKADIEKQKITPGTPAWNQKQQEINSTSMRAQAYMGNYLQRSKNVDLGGGVLPGAPQIADDEGGRTVVGTGNAATAIKNQGNVAQFNDVRGSLTNLEKAARTMSAKGQRIDNTLVAGALAQPEGTASQWLQGQIAKSNLTPEQRDYVINLVSSRENLQAMRKAGGLPGSTEAQVDRLLDMLPNASTPDLDYFLRQTGQIHQTANRLGTGVTTAHGGASLQGESGANGTPAASPSKSAPTPETHVFDSSAYAQKHPKADMDAVKAEAKRQGYTVK